jgi:hypothetical protein
MSAETLMEEVVSLDPRERVRFFALLDKWRKVKTLPASRANKLLHKMDSTPRRRTLAELDAHITSLSEAV